MNNHGLVKLFQLEKEMRQAETKQALNFIIVNRLRSLIPFDQAVLFLHDAIHTTASAKNNVQVGMISDVSNVEKNAPFVRWLMHVANHEIKHKRHEQVHLITEELLAEQEQKSWSEWGNTHILWLPLKKGEDQQVATLWLSCGSALSEDEMALLDRITEVAAHALWALSQKKRKKLSIFNKKKWVYGAFGFLFLLGFLPVEQTVLAPAQVIAQDPIVVTAPMNGVIAHVSIEPNSQVKLGDVLLGYEDTELHGRLLIANEQVFLAQTELLSAKQAAFSDARVKAQVAVLENRLSLREVERDYVRKQTEKMAVTAPKNGVIIFNDKTDLVGLPVKTGQRLMQIAEPYKTKLQIDLPAADALLFSKKTKVRLFLDKSPLNSIEAELAYSSFDPYITPSGVLSYRLVANFTSDSLPRLGLRGTAKLRGENVSLFYYVFRRPLSAMRQMIGF